MIFDGIILYAITEELKQQLIGGKIHQIYHISENLLKFIIIKDKRSYNFLISIEPDTGCCAIINKKENNPPYPSNFCSFLRTHLTDSYVSKIEQINFDRILHIHFEKYNEPELKKLLIVELMGKYSNLILVNESNNRILESIKHIDKEMSFIRRIFPGQTYTPPPSQIKISPSIIKNINEFINSLNNFDIGYKCLIENFSGISSHAAKRIYVDNNINKTWENFHILFSNLFENKFTPEIIFLEDKIISLSPIHIEIDNENSKILQFQSMNEALEYYISIQNKTYIDFQKSDLIKNLKNMSNRLASLIKNLQKISVSSEKFEKFELIGKLILANINNIQNDATKVILDNYFSDNNEKIEISLNPLISLSDNAQDYFKKYHKSKDGYNSIKNKIEMTNDEILNLDEIIKSIQQIKTEDEIKEIKSKLMDLGYIEKKTEKIKKLKKEKNTKFKKFKSSNGFEILVGTNDQENDCLTMRLTRPNDMCLHVKDFAGAHVVIKNKTQCDLIPQETIFEASQIAAFYSKAKNSCNVPVDYTYRKFVKKPKGAKAGQVIYSKQKTVFVTPRKEFIEELQKN